jgi:glutamyl-Q tRNA(Asp) synthetase
MLPAQGFLYFRYKSVTCLTIVLRRTMPITRFAPSPTGALHLGHAHSALFARRAAGPNGAMLLRIEDIDATRCRPDHVAAIETDLAWLGLDWPLPVRRQSEHLATYREALGRLEAMGLTYPCFCTRSRIAADIAAAPHGMGPIYPGTCRELPAEDRAARLAADTAHAIRLDVARALALTGPLDWIDLDHGRVRATPGLLGDVVLARKEVPTSYHLAVTTDDALQGVEIVTRGEDLFEATHLHRLLQGLLDLPVPVWHHHRLVTDASGKRLAKRDGATGIGELRAAGHGPSAVRAMAGFPD